MKKNNQFKKFEISYYNGWTRGFSFFVDTSKIFLASTKPDTLMYGILPDSTFETISSNLLKLKNVEFLSFIKVINIQIRPFILPDVQN